MLISTPRYANIKSRDFARSFADATGSLYCARGKKTIDKLVSEARKKGEHTLALVSKKEIAFISISPFGWEWKKQSLKILKFKINAIEKCEPGKFEGKDAHIVEALFGFDSFYSGETIIYAENGKMNIANEEGKIILEIEYKIADSSGGE